MISITIPVVSGTHLNEVLDSIILQTYCDYEIIVVNDKNDSEISRLARKVGAKVINIHGSLLTARFAALSQATGEYVLQLDETRLLSSQNVLEILAGKNLDVAFINEKEVVKNLISEVSSIDKYIGFNEHNVMNGKRYLLPRYYRKDIIMKAMKKLRENLGELFDELTAPEDLLTYTEAKPFIKKIEIIEDRLITHYGDDSLKKIVRKYFRYGTNFAMLSETSYKDIGHISIAERLSGRINRLENTRQAVFVLSLWFIRGGSLLLGYIVQKGKYKIYF